MCMEKQLYIELEHSQCCRKLIKSDVRMTTEELCFAYFPKCHRLITNVMYT